MVRVALLYLAALWTLMTPLDAQTLRVAITEAPPYAIQSDDGAWFGMAVDAWRLIAEAEGWTYDWVAVDDPARALRAGDADIGLPVIAAPDLATDLRLTLPIHTTTLGIAAPAPSALFNVVTGLLTWEFLRLSLGLCALLLVVGAIVWLLERRDNGDQFHPKPADGLGDGFWWAGVTLTTIGYGDKTPITVAGRSVAMLWMLVGLAVTSALTASIVSLTGADDADLTVEALNGRTVAVIEGSATADYLALRGVDVVAVPSLSAGFDAIEASGGDVAGVVGSVEALRSMVADGSVQGMVVYASERRPDLIVFAARDAALAEELDRAVLGLMTQDAGWRLTDTYFGN